MVALSLFGLAVLSIVLIVHEYGHFVIARILGMPVKELGIGFFKSTRIYTLKSGTAVTVGLIPLGGYTEMSEKAELDNTGQIFRDSTYLRKSAVILAGPAANIVFAFLILIFTFSLSPHLQERGPIVFGHHSYSVFKKGLLEHGDIVVSIDGVKTENWSEVSKQLSSSSGETSVQISSEGIIETVTIDIEANSETYVFPEQYGVQSYFSSLTGCVRFVIHGSIADSIGVEPGDCFISINGTETPDYVSAYLAITRLNRNEINAITIRKSSGQGEKFYHFKSTKDGAFGVVLDNLGAYESRTYGFTEALGVSVKEIVRFTSILTRTMWGLVTGETSFSNVVSVYSIGKYGTVLFEQGISHISKFVALISLAVAFFNLLPLYILDGGRFLAATYCAVSGRSIGKGIEEILSKFSITLIIGLMLISIYNDYLH